MLPFVSVVIVSYKTKELLIKCISSVIHSETGGKEYKIEIIVIDNCSGDGTVDMLHDIFPSVTVVEMDRNVGFAAAVNYGIYLARGEHILLLNPDTEVAKDTIWKMYKFLEQKSDAGAVGCKIFSPDGSFQPSAYRFPTLTQAIGNIFCINKLLPYGVIRRYLGKYIGKYWGQFDFHNKVKKCDFVVGACIMLKRAAIQQVGLFDERFFLYFEEKDYCLRLKQMGWNTYFIPFTYVIHYIGQSSKFLEGQQIFELYKSMFYYFIKHKGCVNVFVLRIALFLGLSLRFIIAFCTGHSTANWYLKTLYEIVLLENVSPPLAD